MLLPEERVRASTMQNHGDIEPQITELIELAEKSIKVWERQEATLKTKVNQPYLLFLAMCSPGIITPLE